MPATLRLDHEPPASLEHSAPAGLPESDHEMVLVSQAQSGDKEAFVVLMNRNLHSLRALALRITRNREQAEDTVQDAILKAYAHLPQFEARARFSTWISRITVNEALVSLRKRRHIAQVPLDEVSPAEELRAISGQRRQHQENPESRYARLEVRGSLMRAVRGLLPHYREAFVLTQVRGCTVQEAAERLQLTIPAVKTRIHRARKQLREELSQVFA